MLIKPPERGIKRCTSHDSIIRLICTFLVSERNKLAIASLNTTTEQLRRKNLPYNDQTYRIVRRPQESYSDAEEMQDSILDKITMVQAYIELHAHS